MNMANEAKFVQLLKYVLCDIRSGIVMKKNRVLSVDNELQVSQLSVHVIDLLSILLRWNAFSGIQKAVVYLTDSRTSNSDHNIFWCKFGFGK